MGDGQVFQFIHPAFERWRTGTYGGYDNQMTSAWHTILSNDPQGTEIVMTIELVLATDTIVRVATQPIEVTSGTTGEKFSYTGILSEEPTISRKYQLNNATSSVRSMSISIPIKLIDVNSLINAGRMISGIGEVSLQINGGDYDQRYVLIRGGVDDGVTFGASDGECISLSISDPKETCDLSISPFEVTLERWPKAHESAIGARYPIVLNKFGRVPAVLVHSDLTVSPPEQRWLVCYGIDVTIADTGALRADKTSAVYVNGSNEIVGPNIPDVGPPATTPPFDAYNYGVRRYRDALGTPVTLVDMGSPYSDTTAQTVPGTEASIYVEVSAGGGGSVENGDGNVSLIDAMTYLLEGFTLLSRVGINYRLLGKAEARLGGLPVATCINGSSSSSATNTIAYIESELLASFPMVSMVWSNGKYGPVVTDRRDAYFAANLAVGNYPLFDRISEVQESGKSSCLNRFTLRYAYNALEDNYTKAIVLDETNSALCQLSMVQCGSRPSDPLESLLIEDDNTASVVMEWMVQHLTFPSYYVEYVGATWLYFNLDVGDNVRLTDAEFTWNEEIATVEKLEYNRGICTIGFRVWWRYCDLSGAASTIFATESNTPTDITSE